MREPGEGSHAWMLRFHLGTETVRGAGALTVRRGPGPLGRMACALLGLPRTGTAVPFQVTVTRLTAARPAPAKTDRPARTGLTGTGRTDRTVPAGEASMREVPAGEVAGREAPVVERWERVIGGRRLVSHQIRVGERGWERHGPLEVRTRTIARTAPASAPGSASGSPPGSVAGSVEVAEADAVVVEVVQRGAVLRAGRHEIPVPARLAPRVRARAWTGPPGPDGGPPRFHLEVGVALPVIGRLLSYRGHCEEERA
ncbi:DUF4166 domain-containing protein [Sphaerisporangium dianthi]|uniref:DUF4166 domain-containing protein n=1 Tax=Sphaerisporangium dianthi TaxID=1436120 RepID=A0ABV9CBW7_9ACTN